MKMLKNIKSLGYFKSCKETFIRRGMKGLIKKEGWSIVVVFAMFYLVRDTILFIIIPYIGISSLGSCF